MSPTQFGGPVAWSMRWCFRQADATTYARCLGDAYTGRPTDEVMHVGIATFIKHQQRHWIDA